MPDRMIIGFSTNKNRWAPAAWAIRWVEGTPYSHTYLRFWSDSLRRNLIYHAADGMVNFTNMDKFTETSDIIEEYEVHVTPEQKAAILRFCVDSVWIPYGRLQLVGMAIVRVAAKIGLKMRNPFKDGEKTQVCSELVGHALELLGVKLDERRLEVEGPKFINELVRDLVAKQKRI